MVQKGSKTPKKGPKTPKKAQKGSKTPKKGLKTHFWTKICPFSRPIRGYTKQYINSKSSKMKFFAEKVTI
jgi:hypothetical protein